MCSHIELTSKYIWNLHQNGQYSVHSLYLALINNGVVQRNTIVWKMRVPLKIKIFIWYIQKGAILTKDNLARQNWNESEQCCFHMNNESIHHLFYNCYYEKFLSGLTHITFGITSLQNLEHMFGVWTNIMGGKLKRQFLACASALC
jgi:hypothetical protein